MATRIAKAFITGLLLVAMPLAAEAMHRGRVHDPEQQIQVQPQIQVKQQPQIQIQPQPQPQPEVI
jgi:hypothetical protein